MFDFALSDGQRALRDRVRAFASTEIAPYAERADQSRALPADLGKRFHQSRIADQFLNGNLDEAYLAKICMVTEELAYDCAASASFLMLPVFFNRFLLRHLSPDRAADLRAELAEDHVITSFAASERDAGSDLQAMSVTLTRTNEGYRLDGRKEYSSNVRAARHVIVVARGPLDAQPHGDGGVTPSASGITWVVLPTNSSGVSVGERWNTLGLRALDVSPIEFNGALIPADLRLGEEGAGLQLMQRNLAQSRTGIAALAVGIARRARDLVLDFGRRRRLYGDKLIRLQDYRFHIADMEKEIAAARSLVALSADKFDRGLDHGKEASIAKLYAGQMVMRVTEAASLMLGSVGYTGQSQIEKLLRDARHVGIVEGPEPIHREIIFAELLRRGTY
jgi:alkylation response protein AidB-like acyl-CoA dehydrogenase